MKNLKLRAEALGATHVLSRAQMRNVLGGSAPEPPQCGSPSDAGGCKTSSCTIKGGVCDGKEGTCGGVKKCSCGGAC